MKKLLYLFSICLCLAILGLYTPSKSSQNSGLTLIMEADACTASIECSGYLRIYCSGSVSCVAYPAEIVCDGNQSKTCDSY